MLVWGILTIILWWLVVVVAITVQSAIFITAILLGWRLLGKLVWGEDFKLPFD